MNYRKIDDVTFSISGRVHKRDSKVNSYSYVDCNQCRGYAPGYMLKTPIWNQARQGQYDFLCLTCVVKNLGRPLAYADFTDAPINLGFWGFDKRELPDAPKVDPFAYQKEMIEHFKSISPVVATGDPIDVNSRSST